MISHWYSKDGKPNHFAGPKGKGTSLREARKLGLFPSVTTIGNILAKPALTNWLQEEAAMMAVEMSRNLGWPRPVKLDRSWAKTVVSAARKKTMALANKGSDIHDILEMWFKEGVVTGADREANLMCEQVANLLVEKCGTQTWMPEQTFSHKLGFGGKVDLHSAYIELSEPGISAVVPLSDFDGWIIDYKSKDGDVSNEKGWPNQAEQLVAYAHGLGIPNARTANIFISRDRALWGTPAGVSWYEHKDKYAWERFKAALSLWQISKRYGPAFEAIKKESK